MQQKNAKICVIQLNENNGNGNASVVFFVSFHLVWRCFFQQRFVQKCNVGVYAVFISFQCFV